MSEQARIAIVGASVAGVSAAEAARGAGFAGEIHLYDTQSRLPYDRPPLSKDVLSGARELDSVSLKSQREWEELDIDLRLGQPVLGIDSARAVRTAGGWSAYDGIVLAPGTRARRVPFPVDPRAEVHVLRSCDDAVVLRDALSRAESVVIVGGGFVGLEVASVVTGRGATCTVVEAARVPLGRVVGDVAGQTVLDRHRRAGCRFRLGTQVESVGVSDDGRTLVLLSDGDAVEADVVLLSIGVVPATDFLDGSGLALGDGIDTDEFGETSIPRVYAGGDAANAFSLLYQRPMRIEHWTTAREQGAHAAANLVSDLAGRDRSPFLHVPYVWSDQLDLKIQIVGRLLEGSVAAVDHVDEGSVAVSFWQDRVLVGGVAINRARDAMAMRRAIDTALRDDVRTRAVSSSIARVQTSSDRQGVQP